MRGAGLLIGAELDGEETPSMWGRYDRVLVTSGLSKAYGLPGLRIGWLATHDDRLLDAAARFKDYTTICSSAPSEDQ